MSVFFPGLKLPQSCLECGERDPEYGNCCILMPMSNYESFEEQYKRCPIIALARTYGTVTIPPGSRIFNMNGVTTYKIAGENLVEVKDLLKNLIWKEGGE